MEAVTRREFDAVVITKLDCLARSTRHLCELADTFKALAMDLVVLDQSIYSSTPSGKLLFDVLAAVMCRVDSVAGLPAVGSTRVDSLLRWPS